MIVDQSGGLHFRVDGQQLNQEPDAQLMIVKFDIKNMKKRGKTYFQMWNKGLLSTDSSSVIQGFVEKSNINPVREMTALIETNRLVGMYQKVMDTQMNDLNSDAINKLGARA